MDIVAMATAGAMYVKSQTLLVLTFLGFGASTVAVQLAVLAGLSLVTVALTIGVFLLLKRALKSNSDAAPAGGDLGDEEVLFEIGADGRSKPSAYAASSGKGFSFGPADDDDFFNPRFQEQPEYTPRRLSLGGSDDEVQG